MKKIAFIWFFLAIFITCGYSGRRAEKLIKIGCVDIQKVFEESPGKKMAEEAINKKKKEYEEKKKKIEQEIEELQKEYHEKIEAGEGDEAEEIREKIEAKKKELKALIDKANEELSALEDKLITPVINDIRDVIKAVAIKNGFTMIIDKSTYVLFVEKEYDITDEVIKELKLKYPEK